jgi:hypothetical protein
MGCSVARVKFLEIELEVFLNTLNRPPPTQHPKLPIH